MNIYGAANAHMAPCPYCCASPSPLCGLMGPPANSRANGWMMPRTQQSDGPHGPMARRGSKGPQLGWSPRACGWTGAQRPNSQTGAQEPKSQMETQEYSSRTGAQGQVCGSRCRVKLYKVGPYQLWKPKAPKTTARTSRGCCRQSWRDYCQDF